MTEKMYNDLIAEIKAIEKANGIYLVDEMNDIEDVYLDRKEDGYWKAMIAAASMAAGMRAEEAGVNINTLIGRVIY